MKRRVQLGISGGAFVAGLGSLCAQTHVVKKPEAVVRAVTVYEWTGDEAKPAASRMVPVSVFIDGQMQDAGVFLARPIPFALDTGTVYEVRKAGVPEGTIEVAYDHHLATGGVGGGAEEVDNGWLGYGAFKPKPKEVEVAKKQSGPLSKVEVSGGSKPSFSAKNGTGDGGTDAGAKTDDADGSRNNPDQPTFHKRPDSGSTKADDSGTSKAGGTSDPDDPAERPTLKRRTPAEIKADQKKKDTAKVVAGGDLNDDPDRPTLHRGAPAGSTLEQQIPPLTGLPKEMRQMVAVSDAKDHAVHEFARTWESDAEKANVLAKMEGFARGVLAGYGQAGAAARRAAPSGAAGRPASSVSAAAATSKAKKRVPPSAAQGAAALTDEALNGYTLSNGGAATYVYTATSAGEDGVSRYVTVVAQEEPITGLKVALANVTDAAHLDRTPWMRPVDAVDADGSNRASLLMELRAQHTRQFALYRVIGAEAEQVFVTGSTE